MPRSREHEKDPRLEGEKKYQSVTKTDLYIIIQGCPSGCVRREIPGVTQVEKGHEGNTAVVTAYIYMLEETLSLIHI